jgi:hypothetical protein
MDWMLLQSAVHLTKYTDAECGLPQKTVASQVCALDLAFPSRAECQGCAQVSRDAIHIVHIA